jgi:hypothetical protein
MNTDTETIPHTLGIMAVLHMHKECGINLTVRGAEEVWSKQDEESRKRIVGLFLLSKLVNHAIERIQATKN